MLNEDLSFDKEVLAEKLPEMLGDAYYNDPETKQQPTKVFDNVNDMPTLLKNYVSAQRTISKGDARFEERLKGMVKVPDEKSSDEEKVAFRKAVGVPEKAEEYELVIPEGDNKAVFEKIAGLIKPLAHKVGVPAKQLAEIVNPILAQIQADDEAAVQKGRELEKKDEQTLKDEKKENYPEFVKRVEQVLDKLPNGKAVADLLTLYGIRNSPAVMKMLGDDIAPLALEGGTVGGTGGGEGGEKEWFTDYPSVKD